MKLLKTTIQNKTKKCCAVVPLTLILLTQLNSQKHIWNWCCVCVLTSFDLNDLSQQLLLKSEISQPFISDSRNQCFCAKQKFPWPKSLSHCRYKNFQAPKCISHSRGETTAITAEDEYYQQNVVSCKNIVALYMYDALSLFLFNLDECFILRL